MNRRTISIVLVLLAATALPVACSSTPGKVSEDQLATIRTDAARIAPGTKRDAALKGLDGANSIRLSSTLVRGAAIEEWKVEAFHESGSGRDLFVTFLYFVDDTLVDQSDRRIDYRANDKLLEQWIDAAGSAKRP